MKRFIDRLPFRRDGDGEKPTLKEWLIRCKAALLQLCRTEAAEARQRVAELKEKRKKITALDRETLGRIVRDRLTYRELNAILFALCPLLGGAVSLKGGVTLGVLTVLSLLCSSAVIALFHAVLPNSVGEVCHMVLIAGFVTAFHMLLRALLPQVSNELGVFVPLVTVTCIILDFSLRADRNKGIAYLAADSVMTGLSAALLLIGVSGVRELLGKGALWGVLLLADVRHWALFTQGAGGFFVLGCLAALIQGVKWRGKGGEG